FAEKTLPVLKQHLDHARTLASGDRPTQAQDPGAGAVEAAAENTEDPAVNAPRSNDTNQLSPPNHIQRGEHQGTPRRTRPFGPDSPPGRPPDSHRCGVALHRSVRLAALVGVTAASLPGRPERPQSR